MNRSKQLHYERRFQYFAGILNWTNLVERLCWKNLRNRKIGCLRHSVKMAERILIIGIGDRGILFQLMLKETVQTIGVAVNKNFLSQLKKHCDCVLASVSALPLRFDVIRFVHLALMLHLKSQRTLVFASDEVYRLLFRCVKILAVNEFHFYSRSFWGSNCEYISFSKDVRSAISLFSGAQINVLSFLNPPFPIFI